MSGMTGRHAGRRDAIRSLKGMLRAARHAEASPQAIEHARNSALELLDHSVRWGHGRLALHRLAVAVSVGAPVRQEQWTYCQGVYARIGDERLLNKVVNAARACTTEKMGEEAQ